MIGVARQRDETRQQDEPREIHGGLRHEALFYRDDDEFLRGTVPLIEEGIDAGEPVMVIVSGPRIELLQDRLGDTAGSVNFADMGRTGRNPTRLISIWRDFVAGNLDAGRVHGIGEPAWAGRNSEELVECSHHEALLNRAFDDAPPFRLMCPFDVSGLDGRVLEHALRSHPWIVDATGTRTSSSYLDPEQMPDPLADPLAPPPPDAERLAFADEGDLPLVREFARGRAAASGLAPELVTNVVFAINELATNSLLHGGGFGKVFAWHQPGAVVFEVQDQGHIPDALLGRVRPDALQEQGRGLWLVNELCDLLQVRSTADGTRVRLWETTGA